MYILYTLKQYRHNEYTKKLNKYNTINTLSYLLDKRNMKAETYSRSEICKSCREGSEKESY